MCSVLSSSLFLHPWRVAVPAARPKSLAGFLTLAADFLAPSLRDLSSFQGWQLHTFQLHSQFLEKNEIMDLKILPQKKRPRMKKKTPKALFLLMPQAQWALGRRKELDWPEKVEVFGERWQGGKLLVEKCPFPWGQMYWGAWGH